MDMEEFNQFHQPFNDINDQMMLWLNRILYSGIVKITNICELEGIYSYTK